jgi:hypothetical protein
MLIQTDSLTDLLARICQPRVRDRRAGRQGSRSEGSQRSVLVLERGLAIGIPAATVETAVEHDLAGRAAHVSRT